MLTSNDKYGFIAFLSLRMISLSINKVEEKHQQLHFVTWFFTGRALIVVSS